jgi:hypothetical protein
MAILSFYLIQNVMDKKIGKQQIIWIFSGVRVTRSLVLSFEPTGIRVHDLPHSTRAR